MHGYHPHHWCMGTGAPAATSTTLHGAVAISVMQPPFSRQLRFSVSHDTHDTHNNCVRVYERVQRCRTQVAISHCLTPWIVIFQEHNHDNAAALGMHGLLQWQRLTECPNTTCCYAICGMLCCVPHHAPACTCAWHMRQTPCAMHPAPCAVRHAPCTMR
eukprot:354922-Chlamydomonas_euryale.AAC.13